MDRQPDPARTAAAVKPDPAWEHFHHGADVGVRGRGATKAEAFENAALALMAALADLDSIMPSTAVEITCQAPDDETLLVDWLNAVIYEMAVRGMLFGRFEVEIGEEELRGTAWGEAVQVARHQPVVEAKGATYTALQVARDSNGRWVAQCVVDV